MLWNLFEILDCIRNVMVETRRLIDHSAPHSSTHSNLQDIFTSSFQEKKLVGPCESLNKTCEKNHMGHIQTVDKFVQTVSKQYTIF